MSAPSRGLAGRQRVLFLQPELGRPAGGYAVAAWMLEALKGEYDVTLLSWRPVDLNAVNRLFGTRLRNGEITVRTVPGPLRRVVDGLLDDEWRFYGYCILMRWCRWLRRPDDILMSASNETDFGAPGVQYVHFPYQCRNWTSQRAPWFMRLASRVRPWRLISGFSFPAMADNTTLVNSSWTAARVREAYGIECQTVYPPVWGPFVDTPWPSREAGFVSIGRLSEEKRFEVVINVLKMVRTQFPEVHLHIVGFSDAYTKEYCNRLRRTVRENAAWVSLEENLDRQQLHDIVGRHRYGIHGMPNEHFGIAVAEMVAAGCVVFVPDSGGQVEIVGPDPRLRYRGDVEARDRILDVLANPGTQTALRQLLAARKDLFTAERFMAHIRDVVRDHAQAVGHVR